MIGWKSMRRAPGPRRARTAASCVMVMSTEVRQDLADQFLGDLGQIVLLTSVAGDLLEDALLGFGGERRRTPGHHRAAGECLHLSNLLSGRHVLRGSATHCALLQRRHSTDTE